MIGKTAQKSPGKFRLRTTLVMPFVLQIVAAVGLVGYLSFRNGQRAVNDLVSQLQDELSSRVKEQVQVYLEIPATVNQINEDAARLGILDFNDLEKSKNYLWKQVLRFKSIGYVGLANEKGQYLRIGWVNRWVGGGEPQLAQQLKLGTGDLIYYNLDKQGNSIGVAKKTPNYDVRKRPFYENVLKNNRAAWSEAYINFGYGSLQINASSPYYDERGQLIGIFTCQMGLDQIRFFLQKLKVGRSGQVFVIEPSGALIASSLSNQSLTVGKDKSEKRLKAQESSDPIVRRSMDYLNTNFRNLDNLQDSIQSDFKLDNKLDNQRYFLKVSPLRDEYGLNWLIVVVVPESDFMEQINANTRDTIWLCLMALGIAIAIGVLTSDWVTKPIHRVSQASKEIAKGNLDQRVALSPIIEIDGLAASFNSMAEQLKESFDALRQSEATNRAIVTTIPDLMIRAKGDGTYLDIVGSDRLRGVHGVKRFSPGSTVQESLPPDLAEKRLHYIRQALLTGELQVYEHRITVGEQSQDEEVRILVLGEDEVLIMVRDITDRKRTEEALVKSEERFRGLVANIPGVIYRCQWDSDWTMEYISDVIETITGYPASDLIQNQVRTYTSIIHPDDRDFVEVVVNHGIITQEPYVLDYRVLHRDGSIRWVSEQGQALFDADENPLYLDGAIFDITDRKRAEEALRIAEENYRSIFENALEGIFQSSLEGRYITVNPALAKIYGYDSPSEMIESITDIGEQIYVDPEKRVEFRKILETQGSTKGFEYRCYCKDGSIIWTQIDARVVKDSNGQPLYYEGIVQDITERKCREDELRQQLEELKIEIDQKKREKEVAMLTESSYFQEVQQEIADVNLDEFWS